jgi:hypothetical protein
MASKSQGSSHHGGTVKDSEPKENREEGRTKGTAPGGEAHAHEHGREPAGSSHSHSQGSEGEAAGASTAATTAVIPARTAVHRSRARARAIVPRAIVPRAIVPRGETRPTISGAAVARADRPGAARPQCRSGLRLPPRHGCAMRRCGRLHGRDMRPVEYSK